MLRFKPDSWLEGLLRPLTLLDPSGYVYVEFIAPDLRFAALLLLTLVAVAVPRARRALRGPAWGALAALWLAFFVWTVVIGNGRYFVAGLLVVGPLLVVLVRCMPFTAPMRVLTLLALLGLQVLLVRQTFEHQIWALARWHDGPALPLAPGEATALRAMPAVFVTITNISHSVLVPQFHPASRWVNLFGQVDLRPGRPEYTRWQQLRATPLPRYVVLQSLRAPRPGDDQPQAEESAMIRTTLARYALRRNAQPCEVLRSHWRVGDSSADRKAPVLVYWVCEIEDAPADAGPGEPESPAADLVAAVERQCPKYFPAGGGKMTMVGDLTLVHYRDTDMRLYIESSGGVYYRHMRALNPTRIGDATQFRAGSAQFDCDQVDGRYRLPWLRD